MTGPSVMSNLESYSSWTEEPTITWPVRILRARLAEPTLGNPESKPKSKIVGSKWALWRTRDCADRRKYLINKGGGGRGPVAPPVFKTGLAANIVAGGFDSLPPPPVTF